MAMFPRVKRSLRTKLILGMAIVLLPLIAITAGGFFSARIMMDAFDEVVKTQEAELSPVSELQKLLLQAAMPPNDYLILGDRAERDLFLRLSHETDAAFARIFSAKVLEEEDEQRHLTAALAEWAQARAIGFQILALDKAREKASAGRMMKSFDAHIDRATRLLDLVYQLVKREAGEHLQRARMVQIRIEIFMIVMFVLALAIALLAGVLMSRSILAPIRALHDGLTRFSQGDHSLRLELERTDELGQLAQTFNSMASRLEYDALTGVYNRYELHRKLRSEIDRSLRYGRVFSLLMVDIDFFKKVNDHHGHQSGDEVLRSVATTLNKALRSADILARYGGEEFAVILPETAGPAAAAVAERLRHALEAHPIALSSGAVLNLTVSLGVATFPADARTEESIIASADQALYAAKEAGRNRVCIYSSPSQPFPSRVEPESDVRISESS